MSHASTENSGAVFFTFATEYPSCSPTLDKPLF